MAIWLNDTIHREREFYSMSGDAIATLIELWCESRLAKNDGVFETERLHKVADHFSKDVLDELVEHGWLHRDATGCGTDWCPKGARGFVVVHNVAGRQESRLMVGERSKKALDAKRDAAARTNHERWHVARGVVAIDCPHCVGERPGSDRGAIDGATS
jgi:hypothetical protein